MTRAVRVKVCGITRREDAVAAVEAGADAVGFLVGLAYPSEDQLSPHDAGKIAEGLPPFVTATLVTHRVDPAEVLDLLGAVRAQAVQLHGAYPLEAIPALRDRFPSVKVVKTVHVDGEGSVEAARRAARWADAVLLDTRVGERSGGTGVTHDWSISRRVRDALTPTPVILAGGLTPGNVGGAIACVDPYAVDVNSGVSVQRGEKSRALMEAFVAAVRSASTRSETTPHDLGARERRMTSEREDIA